MGAGDHVRRCRADLRALHADAELRHDDRDARADIAPRRLPSRADFRDRADRGEAHDARARRRDGAAHRHVLRPGCRAPCGWSAQ